MKKPSVKILWYGILSALQLGLSFVTRTPLSGLSWIVIYACVLKRIRLSRFILYFWGTITVILGIGNIYALRRIATPKSILTATLATIFAIVAIGVTIYYSKETDRNL